MPAVSQKQQRAMAIAEHDPSKLYARNEGLKGMSQGDLHDFASTPRHGLPLKAGYRQAKKGLKKLSGSTSDAGNPPSDTSNSFPATFNSK